MQKRPLFLFIILILGWSNVCLGQQDVHFSQYMFAKPYWNPAYTGDDGSTNIFSLLRMQWVGYSSSFDNHGKPPSTQFFAFNTPFTFKEKSFGIGGNIVYDQLGPLKNLEVQGSFAYFIEMRRGRLSIGFKPGIYSQTIDADKLRTVAPDPTIINLNGNESNLRFDLGAGIAYHSQNYSFGVGASHLLKPTFDYGGNDPVSGIGNNLEITYNLYGDYTYQFAYNVKLIPSVLVKTDIKTYTIDLSLMVEYGERIWGGLSYRDREAMVFLMGYSFLEGNKLKVGYSLDYVIDEQNAKQPTSHEFFVRYDLPTIASGSKKIIRTPRFRF